MEQELSKMSLTATTSDTAPSDAQMASDQDTPHTRTTRPRSPDLSNGQNAPKRVHLDEWIDAEGNWHTIAEGQEIIFSAQALEDIRRHPDNVSIQTRAGEQVRLSPERIERLTQIIAQHSSADNVLSQTSQAGDVAEAGATSPTMSQEAQNLADATDEPITLLVTIYPTSAGKPRESGFLPTSKLKNMQHATPAAEPPADDPAPPPAAQADDEDGYGAFGTSPE